MIGLRMLRRIVSVAFTAFGTFVLVIAIPDIVTGKQSAGLLLRAYPKSVRSQPRRAAEWRPNGTPLRSVPDYKRILG